MEAEDDVIAFGAEKPDSWPPPGAERAWLEQRARGGGAWLWVVRYGQTPTDAAILPPGDRLVSSRPEADLVLAATGWERSAPWTWDPALEEWYADVRPLTA